MMKRKLSPVNCGKIYQGKKKKKKNKRLNFDQCRKRLFVWLAEHPEKKKSEWPEWDTQGGAIQIKKIQHECFACAAGERRCLAGCADPAGTQIKHICENHCPIEWPERQGCESRSKSLFSRWKSAKRRSLRVRLAYEIAGLPWHDEKMYEL